MARKIVITSGKGGVGKTTICANLGNFIAWSGYKVVLMDLDVGLNNLDVTMGLENKVVFDLFDVVNNKCRARQALIQDGQNPYLYVLPSNRSYTKITRAELAKVVAELDDFFDYIFIDCPAGIEDGFHRAVGVAEEAVIVVTPQISSVRDADKVVSILKNYGIENISCVVNRVRGDLILNREMLSVEDVYDLLNINMLGVVPDDDDLVCVSDFYKIYKKPSKINRVFTLLKDNLIDGTNKIFDCSADYRGFLGFFRRKIKRRV